MSNGVRFSVIIPVKNDAKNIARCLNSLRRIAPPSQPFEVIVVDNGSSDGTLDVVKRFSEVFPLTVLSVPGFFISVLRNAGASVAKGTWLAFLDSDCEVRRDWLTNAQTAAANAPRNTFGSFYEIPAGSSWVARYWYGDRERKPRGEVSYLPAGDLFFPKELFEKIGCFNESIQTNEDVEICKRAKTSGFPVICFPELAVIHWGTPQTLRHFFAKNCWHGTHVFHVFLKNLPRLLNLKPLLLAFYVLFCSFSAVLCLVLGVLTGVYLPFVIVLLALPLPSCALGVAAAIKAHQPSAAAPMTVLFFVYGLARASSLLHVRTTR